MMRIRRQREAEVVGFAVGLLPARVADRVRCDFFVGADPVAAGLHRFEACSFDRSYRSTPHVAYPYHQWLCAARRATTVVLPTVDGLDLATVVHEVGHVLHEQLRFAHLAQPVTEYGATNHHEAFAEAFAAWALPAGTGYDRARERLYEADRRTVALFEELAA